MNTNTVALMTPRAYASSSEIAAVNATRVCYARSMIGLKASLVCREHSAPNTHWANKGIESLRVRYPAYRRPACTRFQALSKKKTV